MDFFLVEKIAVKRLQQRCLDYDRTNHLFRIDRHSGVIVPRAEWDAIGTHFRQAVRGSAWVLRWSIILQIPVGLLLLSLFLSSHVLGSIWDAVDSIVPGLSWLVLSTALPVAGLIWHGRNVGRNIDGIVAGLAQRPRVPIPPRAVHRGLYAIEIIVMVLFGPGVFIDLYGSLFPNAFEYTPWTGRQMGWSSAIGLAAFVAILARQFWVRHAGEHVVDLPEPSAPTLQRRRGLIARIED